MQPSSLGYGSESDLARVLISCGQVANSPLGSGGRLLPHNFCGGRAVRRSGGCAPAVTGTADCRFRRRTRSPQRTTERPSQRSARARPAVRRELTRMS
jgi:hypothetical protein